MLITVTLEGIKHYFNYLPVTMTSGNGKSDLHKQNVSVCFFSEQKCTKTPCALTKAQKQKKKSSCSMITLNFVICTFFGVRPF
jgi:hypothetical protein